MHCMRFPSSLLKIKPGAKEDEDISYGHLNIKNFIEMSISYIEQFL